MQPEATIAVVHSGAKEPAASADNEQNKIANSNGVAELEAVLKQKTFTRSEIDQLTALLVSRTADNSVGAERGRHEPKTSELQVVFDGRHEKRSKTPIHENGIEHAVPTAISTPAIKSKVLEEDVASPAELAKAYMGSRTTARVSPTGLGLQNQMLTPYNPPFNPRSPATYLLQKPVNDVGTSENGFATPRFRGRSAIYSMARTPYSRLHPTSAFKAADTRGGSSSSINESRKLNESNTQALKRRSSVLDNDIGSVGPIRRIRQKPNLLHPKTLTLPASVGPRATHGSGTLLDITELPSSSGWSSHSHSLSKAMADNDKPSTSSGYVPSQSMEVAQKIFKELDKFTPKGKSPELKTGGGDSPSKMSPALLGGSAHRSTETGSSLKILQSIQDSKKENGLMDSTPKMVEEASLKKVVFSSDNLVAQNGAEARVPASYSSHDTKMEVASHSGFGHPQKKRGFQMSAHEDYFELDDDVHLNGVASTPLGEVAGSAEVSKMSSPIPPHKEASPVEKPAAPEPKPSDSLLGKKRPDSLVDGPVATNKSVGFTFPAMPSTSPSSSMVTAAITVPKSTADSDKVVAQNEPNIAVPAFTIKSDKFSPFSFSTPSSVVEAAVQATKSDLPSSVDNTVTKANGPTEADKKSTQELADGLKKPDDTPSPVISSAKGIFNFGSPANTAAPTTTFPSPVPTSATSSPGLLSGISSTQSALPVSSVSFPSPLFSGSSGLSNGFAATSSFSGPTTASSSQPSSSPTVSAGATFKFGSSVVPSTLGTSTAALAPESSGPKSTETTFSNASSSIFGAKSPETPSGFNTSIFKTAGSTEAQTAAPTTSTASIFGFQATSSSSSTPVSTSSAPVFGSSGTANLSSRASLFGAVPPTTATTASSSSGVSSMNSLASSTSATSSSIFGASWQPSSKPTFPGSTSSTTSTPSTGFSFGGAANGSSSASLTSSSPFVFGSTPSSASSTTSTAPFVFGSSASSSPAPVFPFSSSISTPASTPSPSLSQSQQLFGASNNTNSNSTPTFGFGGNTEQMSMEDTMAEDSMQAPTPPTAGPVFGQPPISAPSSGFMFGAPNPSPSPAPGFMGAPAAPTPGNPFQFGSQPNPMPPQNNPSPFQPSSSVEFNAGGAGSFSLGSGGGDKANRRIVRVKSKTRRK